MLSLSQMIEKHKNGTYVSVEPDQTTTANLKRLAAKIGTTDEKQLNELHVTVIYSKVGCPKVESVRYADSYRATFDKFEVLTYRGANPTQALVIVLNSPSLNRLNSQLMSLGAVSDFDNYKCHITLDKDWGDKPIPKENVNFDFAFDKVSIQPLRVH